MSRVSNNGEILVGAAFGLETMVPLLPKQTRVLLVDDDRNFAFLVCEVLALFGYQVEVESSAISAYERLKTCDIEIVLTDVSLPIEDGYEFTKKVQTIYPGLPIIILTAHAFDSDREKAQALGAGYLSKPFECEDLASMIYLLVSARLDRGLCQRKSA